MTPREQVAQIITDAATNGLTREATMKQLGDFLVSVGRDWKIFYTDGHYHFEVEDGLRSKVFKVADTPVLQVVPEQDQELSELLDSL